MINRRNVLKATAIGGSGLAALAYSPRPALAVNNWSANSPSQVSNENGELSTLEIPENGFSFSLDYSGLGAGPHSIEFELEARLASGGSSFETVFSDSFEVEGDSGTVNESKLSTSFPVDLLASTSMDSSDFNEPNAGETKTTTVDLRASFSWSDGEYSSSDSATSSFNVNVTKTAPTDGLVAHYPFDGDADDETDNGNDGTVNGATYHGSGRVGTDSLSFDGEDDYVDVGLSSFSPDNVTISAWVYDSDTSGNRRMSVSKGETSTEWSWSLLRNSSDYSNAIQFEFIDDLGQYVAVSGVSSPTDTWKHVVGVVRDGTAELYVDGEFSGDNTKGGSSVRDGSGFVNIGRKASNEYYWKGRIDDVRIYDRALSESEVTDLYNATS